MNCNITNLYPIPTRDNSNTLITDRRLTVSNSVVSLVDSTAFNANTRFVVVDIQSADVMVTFDGSNPSSSNGHRLASGSSYTWSKATASTAKFIRQDTTDAAVHASEFTI
jgi:hypothetical protein